MSLCYTVGCTAVSIPPEEHARVVHASATKAYTSILLEYVREQLLAEGHRDIEDKDLESYVSELESPCSTSLSEYSRSYSTNISRGTLHSVYDIDTKLALAKERWQRENCSSSLG